MEMEEDCIGSPGPHWSVELEWEEKEQKKYLCLTKYPVMKTYRRVKAFLTSPLSAAK
jgi:hypothetical protein